MRSCLSILGIVLCLSAPLAAQSGTSFTDNPLVAGVTPVRAVHLTELRTRINALRTANGLPTFTFTDPVLAAGITGVRAVHLVELRIALNQVYTALGLTPPVFADPVIQPGARVIQAVHITELRTAVIALPNQNEDPRLSPAVITLANVAENTFNNRFAAVRFEITNGQFSVNPDHVQVFHTGRAVNSAAIEVTANAIVASGMLVDGPNEIELLARDSDGRYIDFGATLWAGFEELHGRVVDESAQPIQGAVVTAQLGIDPRVRRSVTTTATGEFSFDDVPPWTVILESTSAGNRHATASVRGPDDFVELQAQPIGAPSSVANNDFSLGTQGWEIGTAPVEIVPHEDERAAADVGPAATDFDMKLSTSGEGAQKISRTFTVTPGQRHVKVRYRFVTSEVPGGYFGTEFDDSFSVSVRSQGGGGVISESASMNGLGLGAFDAAGATRWRETSLPVSVDGDIVRVDLSVANVADGLYDSYLVIDAVVENNLVLSDVELRDIDDSPLEFLSGSAHPYFNGNTRIRGTLTVEGDDNDTPVSVALELFQNSQLLGTVPVSAAAQQNLRTTAEGAARFEITFSGLLFELPSALVGKIDADSTLFLRAFARSASGKYSVFPAGKVSLLVRYTGANRYGGRDSDVGGDDWARPGMVALASHFSSNLYGDFSNMNGGPFSPHAEHRTGQDVDGWFPGYHQRNASTAATIIGHLNDAQYGSSIRRVLVTFEKVDTDAFWNAIKDVVLTDGRRARDVIHPAGGRETHFHWDWLPVAEERLNSFPLAQRRANVR